MKKIIIFTVLISLIIANSCYSQNGWYWQNPLPQGNYLNDVEYIGNGVAITCGEAGTILRTTNNGINWSIVKNDSGVIYRAVDFYNSNTGWIITSYNGRICKTTNGGITWNEISIITGDGYDIKFTSIDTGYAVVNSGNNGFLFKTTNSGFNWVSIFSQSNINLYSLCFVNNTTGYMCGSPGIFKTTNGGINCESQYSVPYTTLNSIYFINPLTGFAVGSGYMGYTRKLKTTNGGFDWISIGSGSGRLNAICFINDLTGLACAFGRVVRTTDFGTNWFDEMFGNCDVDIRAIDFNANNGIVVGDLGAIVNTTNSGLNWANYFDSYRGYQFGSPEITCIRFANKYTGYAVNGYVILKTINEGNNWEVITPTGLTNVTESVSVKDSVVYLVGGSHILKSTNSGINWIHQSHNLSNIKFVFLLNQDTGYCGGSSGYSKTTNGGTNWIKNLQLTGLYNIYFVNNLTGFAKSSNNSYKTTDGGDLWSTIPSNLNIGYSIIFTNDTTGYTIVNSQIRKTTNCGTNWIVQANGVSALDICFFNENTGFAAGSNGSIMYTTNGGINWLYQRSGTNHRLRTVFMTDSITCYAAGFGKTILKTTTGGNIIGVQTISSVIPKGFLLSQNYPNPFNPQTKIKFDIPANVKSQTSNVKLIIYDLLGREVAILINEELKPGTYEADWDGSNYSSGVYFYKIISNDFTETKKMVLMK